MSARDGYTAEFWARVFALQDRTLKQCEKCLAKHGEEKTRITVKRKPKKRSFVRVRVALRLGKRIHPDNLGLFCMKCRRGAYVRVPKVKPSEIMEPLFP